MTNAGIFHQGSCGMNLKLIGMGLAIAAGLAQSQTDIAVQPKFEVASVKLSPMARAGGEGSGRERVAISPRGVTLSNASLSFCIQWAYNVKFYQVLGSDRLTQDRYDIVARTGLASRKEQIMTMMQALLADRFQLRLHLVIRNMPVYELVATQGGAKLHQSLPDQNAGMSVVNGSFIFQHVTMSEFAERLSDLSAFDRPVLDKTGVEGNFDVSLKSAAREMLEDPSSIFSAVEAVGLKLEARKGPVEILVVDYVEKPSGN
jgi:uncharacterized protein (TIGR03435 family)